MYRRSEFMDDKKMIPYVVYESSETRNERIIHRLIVALLLVVGLLFVSNAMWVYAWLHNGGTNIDNSGVSNYIGENGTIENGN